jgi:hypothetical protein
MFLDGLAKPTKLSAAAVDGATAARLSARARLKRPSTLESLICAPVGIQ